MCTHVDQGVHHFLFISDEHIVKQSKKKVCYEIIFINSLFIIYYDFLKIFNIVGKKKKCVDTMRKVGVKAATFLTGLPLRVILD